MKEHRITVSVRGVFLFRTDWDQDAARVANAATIIQSSMPLAKAEVVSRDPSMTTCSPDEFARRYAK